MENDFRISIGNVYNCPVVEYEGDDENCEKRAGLFIFLTPRGFSCNKDITVPARK